MSTQIMIVEDESIVAADLHNTAQALGYDVPSVATNAEDAIRKAEALQPDLILMDISLGGDMDGIQAAQQIRARFDIPIVYLATCVDEETLNRAKITQPFGYLVKPVETRDLYSTIETALYKHQMEKRLRESEARYRAIVEDQTELICRHSAGGTLSFVNSAFCRFFGQDRDALIGSHFWSLLSPASPTPDAEHLASLDGSDSTVTEQRTTDARGETRWQRWVHRAIRDDRGQIVEYQSVGSDITDRKRAEAWLSALIRAALHMERALTQEQIFAAVAIEFEKLDWSCALFLLDETQNALLPGYWSFRGSVAETAERLSGLTPEGFTVPVSGDNIFGRVIETRRAMFIRDTQDAARRLLAGLGASLVDEILTTFQVESSVVAPLIVDDQVIGLFSVHSDALAAEDVPTIVTFSRQMAAAWHRAQLYQRAQDEIAERERMELALRDSEERYRRLVEIMPDAIAIHAEGKFLWINHACAQLAGTEDPQQLVGRSILDFVQPEYQDMALERLRHVRDTGRTTPSQHLKFRRLDDSGFDAEITTIPFSYDDRPAILTVIRDITEQLQAEREIQQRHQYLEAVLAAVPDAIVTLDAQQGIVEWNPGAERLFGYTPEQAVGKDLDRLVAAPEVYDQAVELSRAVFRGEPFKPTSTVRYRQDGSPVHVIVGGSPIRIDSEIIGLVAVYTDISELKRVEQALEQRAAQLSLLNEIGSQVAAVLELDKVLDTAVRLVQRSFHYHHVAIFVRDGQELVMRARAGSFEHLFPLDHRTRLGLGMVGWVGQHGQPLLANDVSAEPHYINHYPDLIPTRSELSVPILVGSEIAGVLDIQSPEQNAFDDNDLMVIEILADQVAVALENARLHGALKELKEFNEHIVQNVTEGIAIIDVDGTVRFMNPAGAHMVGYEPQELVGASQMMYISPQQQRLVREADVRRARGESDRYDLELTHRNGSTITVQVSGSPRFESGRFAGSLAIFTDITERVKAEAALLQRNRELALLNRATQAFSSSLALDHVLATVLEEVRRLLDVTACSVWLKDPDGGALVCRQSTGPHSEVVRGWRLAPGEGFVGWVAQQGKSLIISDAQADTRHYRKVDEQIQWEVQSSLTVPLRVRSDVIGVLQVLDQEADQFDETDLHLVEPLASAAAIAIENARLVEGLEAEVARRTAEIRAEQEKTETVLRSVGDAIGVLNPEFRIEYVNEAFTMLTGYAPAEVVGRPSDLLSEGSSLGAEHHAMRERLAQGQVWRGETRFQRQDGRVYDASLTIAPMHDAEGDLVGYVFSHQDISGHKELERARSRFITNVSHQLRTPVTNIKLYSELLHKHRASQKTDHYLAVLKDQADGLTSLVQDIIEITDLDSGQGVRTWEAVSLPSMIKTILTRYHTQAAASRLTLRAAPMPPQLPTVKGDQSRLIQALGELVENSLAFTPPGGEVELAIETRVDKAYCWLGVAVRDTGPGIALEERERVFERFFRGRLAESGHTPGTGLGLSIAQEIARAHGGHVTLESEPEEGSCFTLWLRCGDVHRSASTEADDRFPGVPA